MAMLILGLAVFLGLHSIAFVAPGLRARAVAKLGEGPWKGLYAALSIIGLVLLVLGFAQARAFNDVLSVVVGLGLYVFFIAWAHERLFGVSPLG